MPYPTVRRAEARDYESIWSIWMQDHIQQWMSFKKQDLETFKTRYKILQETSDIYVMVDYINGTEKVVGVRRIHYGKPPYQHIAEFCSMGIHEDYQGRGYATLFYDKFEIIVKEKGIKKIELTQSGTNEGAIYLADKRHYAQEAVFPDWLHRTSNDGAFHLYERFIYKFTDENFAQLAKDIPSLKYKEVFPDLKSSARLRFERQGNIFICYHNDTKLFKLQLDPNETTYSHIGFLSIDLYATRCTPEAVSGLKKILQIIMQENRVKKIEFITHNPLVIKICQYAGFFVRGEKLASHCENGLYQNELCLEYSFFGIEDAQILTYSQINNTNRRANIVNALSRCKNTIRLLNSEGVCDILGSRHLENLIYQLIRDEFEINKVFSLDEKKWQPLLCNFPSALKKDTINLHRELHGNNFCFFNRPKLLAESTADHPTAAHNLFI